MVFKARRGDEVTEEMPADGREVHGWVWGAPLWGDEENQQLRARRGQWERRRTRANRNHVKDTQQEIRMGTGCDDC